jgi:3D (Asp-Asp-Asp) domain-containing protein
VGLVTRFLLAACVLAVPSAAPGECVTRSMRITFYTCAEGTPQCLTKQGNQPMPFRTVAVGDRRLLGRWLYIEDLGGWVHASDTGGALKPNWIDVFIGDARMAPHALRLGVQHWNVRVCRAEAASAEAKAGAAEARDAAVEGSTASADISLGYR